jgi:hypothetical protein
MRRHAEIEICQWMGGARTAKVSRPKSKQATTDDAQRSFFSKARSQLTPAFSCGDLETRTTPKLTPGFWKSILDTCSSSLACPLSLGWLPLNNYIIIASSGFLFTSLSAFGTVLPGTGPRHGIAPARATYQDRNCHAAHEDTKRCAGEPKDRYDSQFTIDLPRSGSKRKTQTACGYGER